MHLPLFRLPTAAMRHIHRWMLWLFVLAVLAPTASQALMASQAAASPWTVVCSTPGASTAGATGQNDAAAHDGMEHCAICIAHAAAPALACSGSDAATWRRTASVLPIDRPTLPVQRSVARNDAPPRAPPHLG